MKILLTGSAGFIGRHLTRELDRRGDEVVGVDILNGDDALDFFRIDSTRFDLAIHCAAIVGGRKTIDGSPLSIATNLALDAWYFRWLEISGTPRAVYFSSSAAYPICLQSLDRALRLHESDIDPEFHDLADKTYGLAKITGEALASYSKARVHVFRPFSGYAEDQHLDYPFPSFIERAKRRDDPFEIWGDGTQVRDWIHVDDIVAAVFDAIDQDIPGPVNLGTGRPTDFTTLAGLICEQAGYTPTLKYLTDAPQGVSYRCSDNSKLLSFYTPRVSLEEGIARALRH